jgi:hypothetical protein
MQKRRPRTLLEKRGGNSPYVVTYSAAPFKVLIFCRELWGKTPWTKELAIANSSAYVTQIPAFF